MDIDRIRYLAQNALSDLEGLDPDTAIETARADLRDLLLEAGTDVANDTMLIPLVQVAK